MGEGIGFALGNVSGISTHGRLYTILKQVLLLHHFIDERITT
jgi:hypothetical protein